MAINKYFSEKIMLLVIPCIDEYDANCLFQMIQQVLQKYYKHKYKA